MSKVWQVIFGAGLVCALAALTPYSVTAQGDKKAEEAKWSHGMNLRVRDFGVANFDMKTKKFGIEAFLDTNSGHLIYIDEAASISLIKQHDGKGDGKEPQWLHAMDIKARKAGDLKFDNANKFGVEVFKDDKNGNLIYISQTGSIAVVPGGGAKSGGTPMPPVWKQGMELQVRKHGEPDFNKETMKIGVEVFRDENNGNLIYISDRGQIAVVSGLTPGGEKPPEWKYGFEVGVRKAGDSNFKSGPRYNVEVFQDPNNGSAIYITETGSLSVISGVKVPGDQKVKDPELLYGQDLAVRGPTEEKFTMTTKRHSVEFFRDTNVDGVHLAVSEAGNIAVMLKK